MRGSRSSTFNHSAMASIVALRLATLLSLSYILGAIRVIVIATGSAGRSCVRRYHPTVVRCALTIRAFLLQCPRMLAMLGSLIGMMNSVIAPPIPHPPAVGTCGRGGWGGGGRGGDRCPSGARGGRRGGLGSCGTGGGEHGGLDAARLGDVEASGREPQPLPGRLARVRRVALTREPWDFSPLPRARPRPGVPAQDETQAAVLSCIGGPRGDVVPHRRARSARRVGVLRVPAVGVRRVEEDPRRAVADGYRVRDHAPPIAAADPCAFKAGRKRAEPVDQPVAPYPPPRVAEVRELPVYPLARVAEVRELTVDTAARVAEVRELTVDTAARVAGGAGVCPRSPVLVPRPLAATPPAPDPDRKSVV